MEDIVTSLNCFIPSSLRCKVGFKELEMGACMIKCKQLSIPFLVLYRPDSASDLIALVQQQLDDPEGKISGGSCYENWFVCLGNILHEKLKSMLRDYALGVVAFPMNSLIINMFDSPIIEAIKGGALLGIATSISYVVIGRIVGMSGLLATLITFRFGTNMHQIRQRLQAQACFAWGYVGLKQCCLRLLGNEIEIRV